MFKAKGKVTWLLALVVILIFAVAGCGTSETTDNQKEKTSESSNQSSSESKPINLKLAYSLPETHHIGKGMALFADEVNKRTNGRVTIQVFPNGQLYRDVDIPQSIINGSVDLGNTPAEQYNSIVPGMDFGDVTFLFPTVESIRKSLDGGITALLEPELEKKGVKVLVWAEYGPTNFSNSKRLIKQPEDFKGLQMRGRGKLSQEALKAFGANPSFITAAEQYEAMQRGMVDGVSTGLTSMVSRKLFEVQKYVTVTNDSWGIFPLAINLKVWNGLPKDVQDVILQVSKETNESIRTEAQKAEQKALETLKANKMEVYEVKSEDLPKWREASKPVWDAYLKGAGELGQKLVDIGKKNS